MREAGRRGTRREGGALTRLPQVPVPGAAAVRLRLGAIDRSRRHAALATDDGAGPYLSLVAFALAGDATRVLFATPRRSRKFRNLARNPRVALLLDTRSEGERGYAAAEAVTVLGTARALRRGTAAHRAAAAVLLGKHPALAAFVRAPTTALVEVGVAECVHVDGFQRVTRWRPGADAPGAQGSRR